ncbi:hypothetical protein B481_0272 [Planococcus halocryophilus Or1]|uniref:DUF4181 domain-containing protein n=1 Tax=Planococcus halocryophilus TaxID=1215089 RepID=A0A1C7DSD5_9BACL|nr:DUF4181 domain-containing protein [Planococcus halocryophilus]ANU14509.1 hypothetical protein BBI08_11770 [Planococcus halocryophilus]EMF48151.1 hypothetical protein B481_0272 [Planococcus halocryophilus Or1]
MDLDVMRMRESIPILVVDGVSGIEMAFRFILFIGGSIASIFLVDMLLRKILGVEKKKSVKDRHFNDLHKKWDNIVSTGSGIVVLILALIIIVSDSPVNIYWFLLAAVVPISPLLVRVGFEKKYAENPNEYLITLLRMVITIVIIGTLLNILSPGF